MHNPVIDGAVARSPFFDDASAYAMGYMHIKEKVINDNIMLAHLRWSAPQPELAPGQRESAFKGLCISVTLDGRFHFEDHAVDVDIEHNTTNVLYIQRAGGAVTFRTPTYESVSLLIGESFIEPALLQRLQLAATDSTLLRNGGTQSLTRSCLRDVLSSQYDGVLRDMFVQGKVLEILANEFADILPKLGQALSATDLTRQDINAIKQARDILLQSVHAPPSIAALSRQVGVNQFKLKKGFRELFNTTPYAIVREERMKVAKDLLATRDYKVAEVARLVGVKSQAHFTRAFYKHHGVRPKDIMKRRSYFDLSDN